MPASSYSSNIPSISVQEPSEVESDKTLTDLIHNKIWEVIPRSTPTIPNQSNSTAETGIDSYFTTTAGASALMDAAQKHIQGFIDTLGSPGSKATREGFKESRGTSGVQRMSLSNSSRISMTSKIPNSLSYTTEWIFDGARCEGGKARIDCAQREDEGSKTAVIGGRERKREALDPGILTVPRSPSPLRHTQSVDEDADDEASDGEAQSR